MPPHSVLLGAAALAAVLSSSVLLDAQNTPSSDPRAELEPAPFLALTGHVDSNSPAIWHLTDGRPELFVMTSVAGRPSTARGPSLRRLSAATPVELEPWPGGGVWMEAVIADVDGTWYGYYHNEMVAEVCGDNSRVIPRIGAARSTDRGATWTHLGIVLEAPPGSHDCDTRNRYFVGGIGDLSVMLDHQSRDLYIFYSQYLRSQRQQGIAVARLAWKDRDAPEGRAATWNGRVWLPARRIAPTGDGTTPFWSYPPASPLFPTQQSWHDNNAEVDALWGPSVHWNTHLQRYVMLLNRAKDEEFTQEGVYVSFSTRVDDPRLWSAPVKILNGGNWYPQVIGLTHGEGTDRLAGETARFFMSGVSRYTIRFTR